MREVEKTQRSYDARLEISEIVLIFLKKGGFQKEIKKMSRIYVAAFVAVLSLGLAVSTSHAGNPMGRGMFMTFDSMDLIGTSLKNPQGEFLGLINGVEVDSGGHAFAIVNHGDYDLYGPGGVNIPIPFEALRISAASSGGLDVVLAMDTEHMDFAPFLDPTKSNDRQYEASIYEYYSIRPYWTDESGCP